ncbi:MAG: thioredoxin domain-containing protein [Thiomicrorhabdus sp.]|nr:thioredoxin domain-containing protein [Thiomicrorhabdus sp.]
MSIKNIPPEDFKMAVIDGSLHQLILVVFSATWCGESCDVMQDDLEQIAKAYEGRLNIAVLDIDAEGIESVLETCQVESIPDMKVFHERQLVAQAKGVLSLAHMEALIEPYVRTEEQQRVMMLERQVELLLSVDQDSEAESLVRVHLERNPEDVGAKILLIGVFVKVGQIALAQQVINTLPSDYVASEKAQQVIASIEQLQSTPTAQ